MKKFLYFVIAVIMVLALTACGGKTPTTVSPNPNPSYHGVRFSSDADASTISVLLPDGWESKTITEGDSYGVPILHGIIFTPSVNPDIQVVLACCKGIPGLCGTGKTFEDLDFGEDAGRVIKSTEIIGETRSVRITWEDKPPLYYAEYSISESYAAEWEPLILEILSTATMAEGALSREAAEEAAAAKWNHDYDDIYAMSYDHCTGTWTVTVRYTDNGMESTVQYSVDPDGKASLLINSEITYYKPIIYLYPETTADITVKLSKVDLTCTYPAYNDGWSVTAYPDGTLINHADGLEYSYLFWEGDSVLDVDFAEGFCVRGEDTAAFLQKTLADLGLSPREYNEFIVWWLPQMQDNTYNLITFAWEEYDESAPLDITPAPDTLLRVFMVWQASEDFVELPAPILPKAPKRDGFTVIEWGGTEITK